MASKRIIVGTDFSVQADAALVHAIALAARTGAELVLVHATTFGDVGPLTDGHQELERGMIQLIEAARAEYEAELEQLAERCRAAGVATSTRVANDLPDDALPAVAAELDASLVVVGTHGHTGVRRILLGSVAERVVRLTETNVLVARDTPDVSDGYHHILVPTDFSEVANLALDAALNLAAPGARIELFHSWALPAAASASLHGAQDVLGTLRAEIAARARHEIEAIMQRYARADAVLAFEQTEDAPVQGVRRRLYEADFDLVCMGSHGRRGLRRWVLGSVAEATVRHAPCSVYVFHAPEPEPA